MSAGTDNRTHFGVQVHAVPDLQAACPLGQPGDEFVSDITDQNRHADGHATFAGTAVTRANERIHGFVQIGIGHNHHVVLGAAESLNALAVAGAFFVDQIGNRSRADKTQRHNVRVLN